MHKPKFLQIHESCFESKDMCPENEVEPSQNKFTSGIAAVRLMIRMAGLQFI